MNILGQEQPIIYKMDDMFDPTTALMFLNALLNYVNAMRQDYMQGVLDLKEYNKEYGDFFSPFAKDNENWDRLAKKPIRDIISHYGPDLLRSKEGRAMILLAIMSVPSGELAKLKAGAKNGFEGLATKRDLEAKGLYSQAYLDFLDKLAGRPGFEDWDTLKNGIYNNTFMPYEELGKVTDYIYKGRTPLYKGMKNGSRVYAYDFNDLVNTAKSHAQDFINTPRGAFEWEVAQNLAKQQNPNASEDLLTQTAYDILDRRIADANRRYLSPEKYETDQFALANYNHKLRMQEKAMDYAMLARAAGSGNGGAQGGILQYSDRKTYDMNQSYKDKTFNPGTFIAIQDYWKNRVKSAKTIKEKKEALAHVNWWKGSEKWDALTLAKNGIIQSDGNGGWAPTSRFTNAYAYSHGTNYAAASGGKGLAAGAAKAYGVYQIPVSTTNKVEHDMWKNIFANTSDLSSMSGSNNKYRAVNLSDSNLRYAPIRQANVTGTRLFKYNSIYRKFDRWLRSKASGTGHLVLSGLKMANIPNQNRSGASIDVQGNVSINASQFKEFCNKNGIKNYTKAAVDLGLGVYKNRTSITLSSDDVNADILKDSNKYVDAFYTIPMIRTNRNNGISFWRDLNTQMNKNEFGGNNAYGEEMNSEAASLMTN